MEVIDSIRLSMGENSIGKSLSDIDLEAQLKQAIESVLIDSPDIIEEIKSTLEVKKPYVIVFVGINGSGKTTTIAKFANLLKKQKISVCLAAADTFRAAAIQQLEEHANKLKVPIIKKDYNTDPASVGFEAVAYAKKHHIDVVLIDTAGRMNTKESLMKEMEKINRVSNADMRIFIGESITGNDATEQAKAFNKIIDLSGIILSKADVDEKGGTAISVSHVTNKPIFFLGTGQTYDDLTPFNKEDLIKKLFE
jgi:fused signal recognition particle receptor